MSSRPGAVTVASSLLAVLPDAGLQRLAGQHHAREPGTVGTNPAHVPVEDGVDDRLARDAVAVQVVQDRARKTSRRSEFRTRVQRIAGAAQPLQQRLLRQDRQRHLDVGRAIRRRDGC